MTVEFVDSEFVDGVKHDWFTVNGHEFALTEDNRLLDADGKSLNAQDISNNAVFDAVHNVRCDAQQAKDAGVENYEDLCGFLQGDHGSLADVLGYTNGDVELDMYIDAVWNLLNIKETN